MSSPALAPFHPVVRRWFEETLGEPTEPQVRGWPLIRQGRDVLIAALEAISEDRGAVITTSTIDILRNRAGLLQNGSQLRRARRGRNPAVP